MLSYFAFARKGLVIEFADPGLDLRGDAAGAVATLTIKMAFETKS